MDSQNQQLQSQQFEYSPAAQQAYAAQGNVPAGQANQTAQAAGESAQPSGFSQVPPSGAYGQPYAQPVSAYAPYAPEAKKKSYKWVIPVAVILVLVLITAMAVSSCTKSVSTLMGYGASDLVATADNSVAIITLDGSIAYDGSVCSPEGFKEMLDQAESDPHIKAVVLRVNSGGGTATAGEEMTVYLRNFSKPVVVSSASLNASAAYMISSQADYIYTAKSSDLGAIGVVMQLMDYSGLMDLLGIRSENIVSSSQKDSSYGTRGLTDEERAEYQHQVDQVNEMFIEYVAQGREMSVESVRALATGMTYTGIDAVSNGLADEFGTVEDACKKAAELAGMSSYEVIYLEQETSTLSSLLGAYSSQSITAEELVSALKELK